uniref:WD domaincontaining protein putative n=1 Tax=Albugo laibachii Nc14 TaxID=890382 RepID=F0WJ69_9STRA|nr:WD domaincontaining protein putative [Albugo laibachii Nc14]|eukprot:CCA21316.1 WD domaincontaining protein putative [Albugo laibachii Nc14]
MTSSMQNQGLLIGSSQEMEMHMADATTGAQLFCFKQCRPSQLGIQVIPRTDSLVCIQANKLVIHIYTWSQGAPIFRCHVAERLGPVCVTQCGNFVFAGAQESGKVYVWDVKTGQLVAVWDAHYKGVRAIALTSDDSHLITAGEDAIVHVWRLVDILEESDAGFGNMSTLVSWTDHVLPITSVHSSQGGVNGRVYTSSLDRTCKIWSIFSKHCLYTITLPSFVNVCLSDRLEQRLFAGCGDGKVYCIDLHAAAAANTAAMARIVHTKTSHINDSTSLLSNFLHGHEDSVTAMQLSACGRFLISGSADSTVRVWDVHSRQTLQTMKLFKGPVSCLCLLSNVPANLGRKAKSHSNTLLPVAPFKKYMNSEQPII